MKTVIRIIITFPNSYKTYSLNILQVMMTSAQPHAPTAGLIYPGPAGQAFVAATTGVKL